MYLDRLKRNWNSFSTKKKATIIIAIILLATYFYNFIHVQEIKIPINHLFNFKVIDPYLAGQYCNSFEEAFRSLQINDTEMPSSFREYNITIYCIDVEKNINEELKRSYWNLKHIYFSVRYPIEIELKYNKKSLKYDDEYLLISSNRDVWINGLRGSIKIEFDRFEPPYTLGKGGEYARLDYPKPDYLILKLTWIEPPDIYTFLEEQFDKLLSIATGWI